MLPDTKAGEELGGSPSPIVNCRTQEVAAVLDDVSDHSVSAIPAKPPLAGTPPRPTVRAVFKPYQVLTKSGGCEVVLKLEFPHLQRTVFQHPGEIPCRTEVEDCQKGEDGDEQN